MTKSGRVLSGKPVVFLIPIDFCIETLLYARDRIYILNTYIEITSGGEPNLQN